MPHLDALAKSGRDVVICGDINIAHQEIDLKNYKGNRKNSGFLPEERAWLGDLFERVGWADVYRQLHPCITNCVAEPLNNVLINFGKNCFCAVS